MNPYLYFTHHDGHADHTSWPLPVCCPSGPGNSFGPPSSRRRRRPAQGWVERISWLIGSICLVAAAWTWVDARLFQASASRELASGGAALAPGQADVHAREDPAPVAPGTPIATLEIPRLELRAVVAHGTSEPVLRRALGHMPMSARPGHGGNIVIAGHRDTFFRPLEDIRLGDRILLESRGGPAEYSVEWVRIVDPDEVEVAGPTSHDALTLLTCYPFGWLGSAPQRFVVRARRAAAAGEPPS
jgi:sortase A